MTIRRVSRTLDLDAFPLDRTQNLSTYRFRSGWLRYTVSGLFLSRTSGDGGLFVFLTNAVSTGTVIGSATRLDRAHEAFGHFMIAWAV